MINKITEAKEINTIESDNEDIKLSKNNNYKVEIIGKLGASLELDNINLDKEEVK